MNKDTFEMIERVKRLGVTETDAWALRRISMTLHRWHELECGLYNGCVERDEATGKTYWKSPFSGVLAPIADRETGALKRLKTIMRNYPKLTPYVQGDPRGAALYIVPKKDLPKGADIDSYYSRGVAVYK
jgi:hypothetical protein